MNFKGRPFKIIIYEQEDRYKECQLADELNKAMYAIIMEDINLGRFKQFKWRNIYYTVAEPFESIIKDIEKDLQVIKYIRAIGDNNAENNM